MQFVKNCVLLRTTSLLLMAILISDYTTASDDLVKYREQLCDGIMESCSYSNFRTRIICNEVVFDFEKIIKHNVGLQERQDLATAIESNCTIPYQYESFCSKVFRCLENYAVKMPAKQQTRNKEFRNCMK